MVKDALHSRFSRWSKGKLPIVIPKSDFIREEFSDLLFDLGLNKCVEIGVHYGKNAYNLCINNPKIEYIGVDPWSTDDPVSAAFGQEKQEWFMKKALKRIEPFNATVLRMTSMEAVKQFDDKSLDFVYIDGVHDYKHASEDLKHWSTKVKHGGIIAGHDYSMEKGPGVIQAVNEFTQAHGINEWFITKGRNPSFFWANSVED